jgi:hypothetical protein
VLKLRYNVGIISCKGKVLVNVAVLPRIEVAVGRDQPSVIVAPGNVPHSIGKWQRTANFEEPFLRNWFRGKDFL